MPPNGKVRRVRSRIFLVGLALCAIVVALFPTRYHEPQFKGKTVSEWVWDTSPFPDNEAINAFGTDACPALIRLLGRGQSPLDKALSAIFRKLPRTWQTRFFKFRPYGVSGSRTCALNWLMALGPDAQSAIPVLLELTGPRSSGGDREWVLSTLGMLGTNNPVV